MLEWLIIGGGPHGTHLGHAFVHGAGWRRDRVRVLDPHARPLDRWWSCVEAVGMRYLRSPVVHHLDLDPFSLTRFAREHARHEPRPFAPPYDRPSVTLFRKHCEHVVASNRLDDLRERGTARSLERTDVGWRVETDQGAVVARRVVLALGAGDRLCLPGFAVVLLAGGSRVQHLFEPGYHDDFPDGAPILVVGGGISALQTAMRLADAGRRVTVWSRGALREHQFDSDPGWMGPKYMRGFLLEPDLDARRATIRAARHRGSSSPDVLDTFRARVADGSIEHLVAPDASLRSTRDGGVVGTVGDVPVVAGAVVLATGFATERPGGALVDDVIASHDLPCAACGYPHISPNLEWQAGLYVTGALAELELGPTARNLIGARRAAERLVA